jgi:hypothetical protein
LATVIGVVVFDIALGLELGCLHDPDHDAVRSLPSMQSDPVPIDPTLSKNRWFVDSALIHGLESTSRSRFLSRSCRARNVPASGGDLQQ